MITIIGAILGIGFIILFHEYGHFVAAKMIGLKVEKFSLGFGSPIISIKKGETVYCISAIPLGGFVAVSDDDFLRTTWWQRVIFHFNGPFFNIILAFLLFFLTFILGIAYDDQLPVVGKINNVEMNQIQKGDNILSVNGEEINSWVEIFKISSKSKKNEIELKFSRNNEIHTISISNNNPEMWLNDIYPFVPAIVGYVSSGSPAYQAGLQSGDHIVAIEGKIVNEWDEMIEIINNHNGIVSITIERDGKKIETNIEFEKDLMQKDEIFFGISPKSPIKITIHSNLIESVKYGAEDTLDSILLNFLFLYKLLLKPSSLKNNVGSPIMMVADTKQAAENGIGEMLRLLAFISIAIMQFNLLPIPILDGGQILIYAFQGIFRRSIPLKIQDIISWIGIIFLCGFFIIIIFNDVIKVVNRTKAVHEQKQISNTLEQ